MMCALKWGLNGYADLDGGVQKPTTVHGIGR